MYGTRPTTTLAKMYVVCYIMCIEQGILCLVMYPTKQSTMQTSIVEIVQIQNETIPSKSLFKTFDQID